MALSSRFGYRSRWPSPGGQRRSGHRSFVAPPRWPPRKKKSGVPTGDVLTAEVTIGHGKPQTLAAARRTGLRIHLLDGPAGEAALRLARGVATVTGRLVAVVTGLVDVDVAVAAEGLAGAGHAIRAAARLEGAGPRAPTVRGVTVEQSVFRPQVAGLSLL